MAARKPSMVGVMIRDVLREGQPLHVAAINREVNRLRKERGMRRVTYKYICRLINEAKNQGLLEFVETIGKAEKKRVEDHPELDYMNLYQIRRGFTNDKRWALLPRLARWKGEAQLKPPTGYHLRWA